MFLPGFFVSSAPESPGTMCSWGEKGGRKRGFLTGMVRPVRMPALLTLERTLAAPMKTLFFLAALFLPGFTLLRAQPPSGNVDARLAALEQAYRAGVLTRAEYEKKKAEILASRPGIDEGTKKKLRALEAARKAGILSEEEYEKKKKALLGRPVPGRARAGKALPEYRDPAGRFSFRYPAGWTVKPFPNGRGVNVKSGDWAMSVLFFPGVNRPDLVLSAVEGQVKRQWKDFRVLRRGTRKVSGRDARVVEFQGVNPKKRASRSQLAAFASNEGSCLIILAAPMDKAGEAGAAWKAFYESFRLGGREKDAGPTAAGAAKGNLYNHPIGFTFWYPRGWKVLEGKDGGLRLLPPGDKPSDPRPGRFVFVIGDSVKGQGISGPSDPRVGAFLDRAVTSMLPLERVGGVKVVEAARGGGAEYNWSGKNLQGKTILARAFSVIIEDFGVALVIVGFEDKVRALDGPARKIFASFGFGRGARDPRVVGRWKLVSQGTIYNDNPLLKSHEKARGYSKTQSLLELRSDGTWTRTSVSETLVMGAGTSLSSGPQKTVTRGTWRAGKGVLYLMGDDRTWEDYKYRVGAGKQGMVLVLTGKRFRETWRKE